MPPMTQGVAGLGLDTPPPRLTFCGIWELFLSSAEFMYFMNL